jgi:hypothetical protein
MRKKVFNKLPKHTADSLGNKKHFIRELRNLLIEHLFYPVDELLNNSHENDYEQQFLGT